MSERLDAELVRRGLSRSRAQASAAIEAGRVSVDGRPVAKPSTRVSPDALLEVDGEDRFVSRAALKLEAALSAFPVEVAGRLALDLGASTGGFTQVLLERGAREVIALDVGHGQLAPVIRADPRVRVVEGVNARDLDAASLAAVAQTAEAPTTVVGDLSFISLRHIVPAIARVVGASADVILLVKPQFEVGRQGVREGIVRDAGLRRDAVSGVAWAAWDAGLTTVGVAPSPVLGTHGNHEYLLWLRPGVGADPSEWERAIQALA